MWTGQGRLCGRGSTVFDPGAGHKTIGNDSASSRAVRQIGDFRHEIEVLAALTRIIHHKGTKKGKSRRVPLLNGFRSAVFLPNRDWSSIHGTITSTSIAEEVCRAEAARQCHAAVEPTGLILRQMQMRFDQIDVLPQRVMQMGETSRQAEMVGALFEMIQSAEQVVGNLSAL